MSSLELEPLEKAVVQLEVGINLVQQDPDNELLLDGAIQRFEYTIDLSWKFLQRYLINGLQVEQSVIRSKKDLFREAARLEIIDDAESWISHYEARNATSHNYNHEIASRVYAQAKLFLPDVKELMEVLKGAN